jgi:hypothetical protein
MSVAKEELDKIKIISTEVSAVMGAVPSWILRWGSLFFLISVAIVILVASILPYTQTFSGKARLEWMENTFPVVVKKSGFIKKIAAIEDQTVKIGERLFITRTITGDTTVYTAPANGKIHLNMPANNNQEVWQGDIFFTIVPTDTSIPRVIAAIDAKNINSIKEGQDVNIILNAYPEERDGYLTGTVSAINHTEVSNDIIVSLNPVQSKFKNILKPYLPTGGIATITVHKGSILQHIIRKK